MQHEQRQYPWLCSCLCLYSCQNCSKDTMNKWQVCHLLCEYVVNIYFYYHLILLICYILCDLKYLSLDQGYNACELFLLITMQIIFIYLIISHCWCRLTSFILGFKTCLSFKRVCLSWEGKGRCLWCDISC
jgi:hypothetical protein